MSFLVENGQLRVVLLCFYDIYEQHPDHAGNEQMDDQQHPFQYLIADGLK